MLIIFEGVDCSGKTTIIEQLMKHSRNCFHIRRSDIPASSNESEIGRLKRSYKTIHEIYKNAIRPRKAHLIVERFYPSELAYSKVKRGYEAFDDKFYHTFEDQLIRDFEEEEVVIIYVFQELKILKDRLISRGDDYIKIEELSELNQRYLEFLEWSKINTYSIPGSDAGYSNLIGFLKLFSIGDFNTDK